MQTFFYTSDMAASYMSEVSLVEKWKFYKNPSLVFGWITSMHWIEVSKVSEIDPDK